ncbi:electron transfer flavoprotein subunit alpha [Clostridium botulinum]|uniref:Electron transfer flavoprotein, alpha subunit/FixB family protein n=1 Tax=Clostridium botulinum (strain Okra / Type B1) TaxID=498213 RepID=B1IHZ1_CLOBK|nr:electron transfer flavoprotein subunit alpha/FixB family protein [Clostridium botulinum]EKX79484.1 electron transfer flavoprotein subunit alpha/FixB family protein [Clostridium botulinum CFSAN001628]ACA44034.1 electron transfer flavoprotein, alpha subunit/FixB family protein [Clostridium botulinum B1 str. Okra]MBD5562553.1 electron transfer flavoprotein subunit alpha [Clostridium botulinum]MBD5565524.1 electron transfer flavoprotein subunit alpha [Clostridium botulinum]MBD5569958.1 electron
MGKLVVNEEKLTPSIIGELVKICPFGALGENSGKIEISAACKMCKLCVKKGPAGVMEFVEEEKSHIDKSIWKGIAVYVDHVDGDIHPVTYELIGKARELANKINHPVYAVFIGHDIKEKAEEILHYGVDEVFVYDNEKLKDFRIEPYTKAMEDFISKDKPSTLLVGATTIGRSLAPRVAARFRTGLTADCTILDIKENTDLVQIRPAFGGNIMAQIINPNNRPQLATVRYKVMDAPERSEEKSGKVTLCSIDKSQLDSQIKVLKVTKKQVEESISDADIIIAVGRGLKKEKDLDMINELAELIGAQIATTRPLIEAGWTDAKRQIGLSGRTVKPKLIITCGISGAVQFTAGMNNAECIVAINKDPKASIFNVAHYGIIGDIYEVIPTLINNIKEGKRLTV